MSNDREFAGSLLDIAKDTITRQRVDQHGSVENSFQMIADMWGTYLRHAMLKRYGVNVDIWISPADVAQMMVQLKQARAVYGDPSMEDHYVDGAGYTALAGMLAHKKNYTENNRLTPVTESEDLFVGPSFIQRVMENLKQ